MSICKLKTSWICGCWATASTLVYVNQLLGTAQAVTPRHANQSHPRMQTSTVDDTPFFLTPPLGLHFGSQGTRSVADPHLHAFSVALTMVHTCVVAGCRNRRTPGTALSFYRFPRDPERKQRWIAAVNREGWVPNDGSRLCSTHFISGTTEVCVLRSVSENLAAVQGGKVCRVELDTLC